MSIIDEIWKRMNANESVTQQIEHREETYTIFCAFLNDPTNVNAVEELQRQIIKHHYRECGFSEDRIEELIENSGWNNVKN